MTLPLAISPTQRSPGLGLLVNFLTQAQSPGNAPLSALLICAAGAAGTITADTQIVPAVSGPSQVATLLQQGSPGHLASVALFAELPTAQVDVVAPLASVGTAATASIVFAGTPTAPYTVAVNVSGRAVTFLWNVGESAITGATKCVSALAAIDDDSPLTPSNSSGASATVLLTSKLAGQIGNDITFAVSLTGGSGGTATLTTTSTTIAAGSNGQALPQPTINVASVAGFPTSGNLDVTALNTTVAYTGTQSAPATTVASGSNTVNVNTFAGAGTMHVASTTGWPTTGSIYHPGLNVTITYTGTSGGNSFTGCTTLAGGAGVLATSDAIDGTLFTGCTGGTGSLATSQVVGLVGSATGSTLVGGTLEPSLTNVLNLVNREYTYILLCTSNADADSASGSSNVQVLQNFIAAKQSGTSAWLSQAIIGVTGALSAALVGTAHHDFGEMEYVFCQSAQSLPCEWGGAECGARLREVAKYAAINRINMAYVATLYGPPNMATQQLTAAQEETALLGGVTPVTFDALGNPRPARPITTYFQDTNGNPDTRILDTSIVDGIYVVARDLRTAIPQQFAQKSLSPDLPSGADSIPANVVEIRDVKAFVVQRLLFWARSASVLQLNALLAAIGTPQSPGTLIVQIDPTDPTQVDMFLPLSVLAPLAKFSVVVAKV